MRFRLVYEKTATPHTRYYISKSVQNALIAPVEHLYKHACLDSESHGVLYFLRQHHIINAY